jgi:hypothetical protein
MAWVGPSIHAVFIESTMMIIKMIELPLNLYFSLD